MHIVLLYVSSDVLACDRCSVEGLYISQIILHLLHITDTPSNSTKNNTVNIFATLYFCGAINSCPSELPNSSLLLACESYP